MNQEAFRDLNKKEKTWVIIAQLLKKLCRLKISNVEILMLKRMKETLD